MPFRQLGHLDLSKQLLNCTGASPRLDKVLLAGPSRHVVVLEYWLFIKRLTTSLYVRICVSEVGGSVVRRGAYRDVCLGEKWWCCGAEELRRQTESPSCESLSFLWKED